MTKANTVKRLFVAGQRHIHEKIIICRKEGEFYGNWELTMQDSRKTQGRI